MIDFRRCGSAKSMTHQDITFRGYPSQTVG